MKNIGKDLRDAFFEEVLYLAQKNKNLLFITDDLDALVLKEFKKKLPKQYINIGVAEQTLVDVAAGLASSGKKVFIYGINSYITARCYEQIRFSIASMNLPLVIVGVGSGFSFSFDGSSHHGTSDIGIMRVIPDIEILNPCDELSSRESAKISHHSKLPVYVRLDKGAFPQIYSSASDLKDGFKIIKKSEEVNILSTGFMTQKIYKIFDEIQKENRSKIGFVDVFRLKPLKKKLILQVLSKSKKIVVAEENLKTGGLGSALAEIILEKNYTSKLNILAVRDQQFSVFGDREWLLKKNNLDESSIKKSIFNFVNAS